MADSKKAHKQDRNRPWCKLYRLGNKREASTIRKLLKRLSGTTHGLVDGVAVERLKALAPMAASRDVSKKIDDVVATFNHASIVRQMRNERVDRYAARSRQMRERGVWPRSTSNAAM